MPLTDIEAVSTHEAALSTFAILAKAGFTVEHLSILGDDLHSVEVRAPRPSLTRVTLAGTLQGAWMGLVLLVIFVLFVPGADWTWLGIVPLICGGGAIFAAVRHARTFWERDVLPSGQIRAATYALVVSANHADEARRLLRPPPIDLSESH